MKMLTTKSRKMTSPVIFRTAGALPVSPAAAKREGCLVCGSELVYRQDPLSARCIVCGRPFLTRTQCTAGHYICDECHAGDILLKVERLLDASSEHDPISLANRIFELPGLNMHGPEYHSIVPAVLVAALQNLNGQRSLPEIREAIRRGRSTPGGSCGLQGSCGAGIGAGIAATLIEKSTPMTPRPRSIANRATGEALLAISRHEGARCCKRDSITAIESFMRTTPYFIGVEQAHYACKQYKSNKTCLGRRCPYLTTRKGD